MDTVAIRLLHQAFGLDPRTVSAGRASVEKGDIDVSQERIRQEGGGRKAVKNQQPEFLKVVEEIVSNNTYGSPEDDLLWTNLSMRDISEVLKQKDIQQARIWLEDCLKRLAIASKLIGSTCKWERHIPEGMKCSEGSIRQ